MFQIYRSKNLRLNSMLIVEDNLYKLFIYILESDESNFYSLYTFKVEDVLGVIEILRCLSSTMFISIWSVMSVTLRSISNWLPRRDLNERGERVWAA